jgi:hypothetical protein
LSAIDVQVQDSESGILASDCRLQIAYCRLNGDETAKKRVFLYGTVSSLAQEHQEHQEQQQQRNARTGVILMGKMPMLR